MKGWYGNKRQHSLASRGIKTSDLKNMYIQHLYPYENVENFYNWLVKRGWGKQDALDYIESMHNNGIQGAKLPSKYYYKNSMEAFKNVEYSDEDISEIYYTTRLSGTNSWSRKYGYSGYVWDDFDDLDDRAKEEQKNALLELDFFGDDKSHVKIGEVPFSEPNEIYHNMQGDNWSPLGEARSLIHNKNTHTSMSIGDIIKTPDGKTLIVAGMGFLDIDDLKRRHGI